MSPTLLVMIGGALGAALRYHAGRLALVAFDPAFPWGTWIVNLAGGLGMGLLVGGIARLPDGGEPLRLLLGVGVLGGFTTFSAFSLETVTMILRGDHVAAAAYAVSSVVGSVLMLFAGLFLARAVTA
jgi:CrcB protein